MTSGEKTAVGPRLAQLRTDRGLPQRAAAAELHISQGLLSHYENGMREPGLAFICRACDYYGVTADYLLGRTENGRDEPSRLERLSAALRGLAEYAENGTPYESDIQSK